MSGQFSAFLSNSLRQKVQTMSVKGLRLPVIYAVEKLQIPPTFTTMLFEGDRNSTGGRNVAFPNS